MIMDEIFTRRLRLKSIDRLDKEDLIEILKDEVVNKTYMVPPLNNKQDEDDLFNRYYRLNSLDDYFVYGIYFEGKLIGVIHSVNIKDKEIELGYFINRLFHNKGFASEAVRAVISHLLESGYEVIKAGAFSENLASMKVMEKCGMKRIEEVEEITYRCQKHLCFYYEIRKE